SMYRGRLWTMRQYSGFGTAEETNARYRYLLSIGQTGLSVAFDLPTQMGYDADHPKAEGEVGKVGVSISTLEDMEMLFSEIPLDKVSTSMTINATAPIIWAMYLLVAQKRGIAWDKLNGTLQNDILKEFIARKTYIFPLEPSLRLAGDCIEFSSQYVPSWHPISVSGYHIREAGSNAIQELAYTFLNAQEYLGEVERRGVEMVAVLSRISFFFAVHSDFFEEIAKFRAARSLWAEWVMQRYHPENPEALKLRFHCQTAGSTLTLQDPHLNIARVALQALSGVLGGAQSIHTNSFDEALALPSEYAVSIALKTQQVLAYETGVADVIDPLGGSYFLEALTKEISDRTRKVIQDIVASGGMLSAIQRGIPQKAVAENAYKIQQEIERKERIVVSVNAFPPAQQFSIPHLVIDEKKQEMQRERVKEYKRARPKGERVAMLKELQSAVKRGENCLPPIINCLREYASLGEITDALCEVFGRYQPEGD
ncbi:MAG: methylmalonyl-CoA mutase, partial [bacterium]